MSESKKTPNGITFYRADIEAMSSLPGDDFKAVILSLSDFAAFGTDAVDLSPVANMAYRFMRPKIEAAARQYQAACERNANNASKRWAKKADTTACDGMRVDATACDGMPPDAKHANRIEKNRIENRIEKNRNICVEDDESKRLKRFSPPTADQVREYAAEKGYGIDAQRFVDFYASKGWRVGNSPMKDWQAAVRNWASRNGGNANGNDHGGLGASAGQNQAQYADPYII